MWEILDPSNLKYDTARGRTSDDSGQGPPTDNFGWVRTGYDSSTSGGTVGQGNCAAWISSSGLEFGTRATLPDQWAAAPDIHVWEVGGWPCSIATYVWCVADDVNGAPGGTPVYLPIILKNSS